MCPYVLTCYGVATFQARHVKENGGTARHTSTTLIGRAVLARGVFIVENVYEPDLNASPDPAVQTQEKEIQYPYVDSKRKLPRETSTKRVAKETAGSKVAKTIDGTSDSEVSHSQKVVGIEVGPEAHHMNITVDNLD
ncbi:hypothetical protein LWI28_016708 [Acer negundo]|uniref:Uncharacterized protein n=1 Tax=Acer negundo TaxID=4023 RepID=A0AAD5NRM2_ACENE|nr:hypothetical protein LWI28_016708 [Acer negundo]